jgi:hypothetical protein
MSVISFMIVGRDEPLYELDMSGRRDDMAKTSHFVIHAALDMVDIAVWSNPNTFLKVVDRHNELLVSAYVTAGGARFMMLHDGRNEDGIRGFCSEVHELYVKLLLNPFYLPHSRIDNKDFDARIRALARRYLGYRE